MRVRTEAKRDDILEVAREVFLEAGFDGASMAQISARLGGSKRTLYGYFASKEELFVAVAQAAAETLLDPLLESMATGDDPLRETLERFGLAITELICTSHHVQVFRTMIGISGRSDVGVLFFESGPGKGTATMAAYLQKHMAAGALKPGDPAVAANQYLGLLQAETMMPSLLGVLKDPPKSFIAATTARALDTFLAAYAVPEGGVERPG